MFQGTDQLRVGSMEQKASCTGQDRSAEDRDWSHPDCRVPGELGTEDPEAPGVCRLSEAGGQMRVGKSQGPVEKVRGHGQQKGEGAKWGGHRGQGRDNGQKGTLPVCQVHASQGDQGEPVETAVCPLAPQMGEQLPLDLPWWWSVHVQE